MAPPTGDRALAVTVCSLADRVAALEDGAATTAGAIFGAIAAVMRDIEAIGKDRRADTGGGRGYNFRGIDDVYNELHGHLAKHGVFTVPTVLADRHEERTSSSGKLTIYRILTIRFRFYAGDGSHVDAVVIGEGMDFGDKASNKAMAVAHKYALLQVFAIPTEEAKDPESQADHELVVTFDRANPRHVDNVRGACKAQQLTADEFRAVIGQMHGGPADDERLMRTIAAVKLARAGIAPAAPTNGPAPVHYEADDQAAGADVGKPAGR